jgi:FtsH-binding integral membrane protein
VGDAPIFPATGLSSLGAGMEFAMANWNEPRDTRQGFGTSFGREGALESGVVFDEGLRSHMLSIYNYMASGVMLTGIVALLMFLQGWAEQMFYSPARWIVGLSPLAIVFAMSFGRNKFSTGTLQIMYWSFAVLMGMSLSTIFLVYTGASIAVTFFATAAAFAGLSLWGYTTRKDISAWGSFLIMGVVGLLVASLLNWWLQSPQLYYAVGALGVLIFAGLTAWDTQMLKREYVAVAASPWGQSDRTTYLNKAAINGALSLYLDFINMFLFLLRFMGAARD